VLAHVRSSPRKLVVDPGRPNRRYSSGGPACVVPAHWASTGMRVVRLSAVMSGLFVLLSIPVLIFILAYNYRQNAAAINATLNDVVTKTKQVSIEDAENLINPVAATLRLLAAAACLGQVRSTSRGRRSSEIKIVACGPQTT